LAILLLIVIFLQVIFNAFQDWSTSRTMKSIVNLLPSESRVLRQAKVIHMPATELVVGDIVHLSIGKKVPADIRLLEHSGDLRFDRATLTGESEEVEGGENATDQNFLESRNIVLMGTMVVNGNGVGVVVLTGNRSVMGRIAQGMANAKEVPTLLQREIWRFMGIIVALTIMLALIIYLFWTFWLRIYHSAFLYVVGMLNDFMGRVFAFIPEGMPIGVSLTLLVVASHMKAHHILPKGLSTVETLGCVNVICSDKTGTLTQNLMSVRSVAFADEESSAKQVSRSLEEEKPKSPMLRLVTAATLCNDASSDTKTLQLPLDEQKVQGNATDAALLRFSACGAAEKQQETSPQRVFQIPFNSKNKWVLTAFHNDGNDNEKSRKYQVYVKGAPDVLLSASTKYWSGKSDSAESLDNATRTSLKGFQDKLSNNAERVIMLCEKTISPKNPLRKNEFGKEAAGSALQDRTIIGILGIIDPPRLKLAVQWQSVGEPVHDSLW
jgi:sodium/potassium-transporting ATPase subunit alpha